MEREEAYSHFIKNTGFGAPSTLAPENPSPRSVGVPHSQPVPQSVKSAEASRFEGNYRKASHTDQPVRHVPNAVPQTPNSLPGVVNPREYSGQNRLGTPLRTAPLGGVDARTGPKGGSEQTTWQAVGVGGNQKSVQPKTAASRRFLEKSTGSPEPLMNNQKLYILCALLGIGFILALVKWNGTRNSQQRRGPWGGVSLVFGIGLIACVVYFKNRKCSPEEMGGRKAIGDNNYPVVPIQRDQPDANPYHKMPDPQDTTTQRDRSAGVEGSDIEGPRANYGYQRGKVTAEDRQRLQHEELMRTAKYHNMDEGTFNEYMARLDGEAPNQFVQSHPYMPFSAEWDERSQIDDMSKRFGVGTGPGPANRKYKYRDPRIQQAGARTMHLKDPPPDSVPALNKVHPWLERDESGVEPPVLLGSEVVNHEKLTAQDTQSFTKSRLIESQQLEIPYGKMDEDFMKVEDIKRKTKSAPFPVRPDYSPDGNVQAPRTLDLNYQHERAQHQRPPMTEQKVYRQAEPQEEPAMRESMMRNPLPAELPVQYDEDPAMEDPASEVQKLNRQDMDHRKTPFAARENTEEAFSNLHGGYAGDDDAGGSSSFEAAFAPKDTPSDSEIAKAQEDVRRN